MDNEYVFNIGDEVIDKYGSVGKIIDICHCDRCEMNGWYEPEIEYNEHYHDYITHWDRDEGFSGYYKVGKYVFGNTDINRVNDLIDIFEKRLAMEYDARDVLLGILNKEE